jgi:hypothetical protein
LKDAKFNSEKLTLDPMCQPIWTSKTFQKNQNCWWMIKAHSLVDLQMSNCMKSSISCRP